MAAEVVGAAFHVADAQRAEERLKERDVFEEELFLKVFGAGGDDDAASDGSGGAEGGKQISEGFAGSGAGFDDEVTIVSEGAFDGLSHFELAAAEFVREAGARERAAGREEIVQRWREGSRLRGGRHAEFRIDGWGRGSSGRSGNRDTKVCGAIAVCLEVIALPGGSPGWPCARRSGGRPRRRRV